MIDNERQCLGVVLVYEGGYSNNPRDPGGATMRGVTQRTYDAFRKRRGLPIQAVRNISDADLAQIYREEYWNTIAADTLPPGVDLATFDSAVNSGPAQATRWLKAAGSKAPVDTIREICDARLSFMHAIRGGQLWKVFGKGWGARVADVEARSIKMATSALPAPTTQIQVAAKESAKKAQSIQNTAAAPAVAAPVATVAAHGSGIQTWVAIAIAAVAFVAIVLLILKARQHEQRAAALTTLAGPNVKS